MSEFKTFVNFPTSIAEEWSRAENTPLSDLPSLSPERKAVAKRWGISEEEERRNVLRQDIAVKRLEAEGEKLGEAVVGILKALGKSYHLRAVILDGRHEGGTLRLETPSGIRDLNISTPRREIVHDGDASIQGELKREILQSLGRQDLLVAR